MIKSAGMVIESFVVQALALLAYFAAGRSWPQAKGWVLAIFVVASVLIAGRAARRLPSRTLIANVIGAGIAFVPALVLAEFLWLPFGATMPSISLEDAGSLAVALIIGVAWWSAIVVVAALATYLRGLVTGRSTSDARP